MATDQRNLPAYLDVNATFQTWVQGIHAQLAACGLVQTSDTGQINPATVALPSAGSVAGYEIWRFNDAAQSTQPVYMKIEYGGAGTQNRPSMYLTVGSGSNGTGGITGTTTGRQNTLAGSSQSGAGVTLPSYCSGDGSWIALMTNSDSFQSNNQIGFIIDRIRDVNGSPTGDGFMFAWINANSLTGAYTVINGILYGAAGNSFGNEGVFPGPTPINGGPGLGGGPRLIGQSLGVMPLLVMAGQLRYSKAGVMYNTSDLGQAAGITFTVTNFSANHTYLTTLRPGQVWGCNVLDSLALLWE